MPNSTTLNYLEEPLRTLFQNTCIFGARHENLNEGRPTLGAATLASGNIRLMGIFAAFRGEGASNDSGVVENVSTFSPYFFRISFKDKANIII